MDDRFYLKRFLAHLHTVHVHRRLVRQMCFRCGMYVQGLTHDLSKYSPQEFLPSVRYYQGYRSPINREKEILGYSAMWLHHKGRNKHHWEYWVDKEYGSSQLVVMPMPFRYMLESVIDRISASKVYNKEKYSDKEPYEFFTRSLEYPTMNPVTAKQIGELLLYLKENGEKKALAYYKSLYKKHKNDCYFTLPSEERS